MRIYRRDAISNASLLSRIKIMSYSKIRLIFRIIFISLFFLLLLFVFYRNLNPLGLSRVYNYSFSPKINHFINPLLPKERVSQYYFSQTGDWYQTLKGPLVYFSLYPVSPKQQVKITVKYKSEVPEIIFGKVTSAGEELEFRASPFYHSFILLDSCIFFGVLITTEASYRQRAEPSELDLTGSAKPAAQDSTYCLLGPPRPGGGPGGPPGGPGPPGGAR